MDERVIRILEFDKLRLRLGGYTVSSMGNELAQRLLPSMDKETVRTLQTQTAEALEMLKRFGQNPVDEFPDMRVSLKRSHVALTLTLKELMGIQQCLRVSRMTRERLCREDGEPLLRTIALNIQPDRRTEEEIGRCIISEEEVADNASEKLSQLRRQIRSANERVRDKLNSMIHSAAYQKFLQEPIITIRNGRYVLPVRQEYRQNVPGLLHDQSGSGATLFIEPMSVVEIGNELKRLTSEENEEIERILTQLTALLQPNADNLINNLEILSTLDVIFAKAALAREMDATAPEIQEVQRLRIIRGRHPLLDEHKVVPIDIWLGEDFATLIITGPNTGGKTVTLKTVGLFALMFQAGLMLPAQGAQMPVFESIVADIGDEQSIEQSLSTFSSHMTNIVGILNQANDKSLVLLDELGAGTDPNEGAALAMAILENLHARHTITLATTHYSELKAFALTRSGMENASMEFDVATLRPTYRLFIGIPGKSNAFEISAKLGLSERVIDAARRFLKHEDVRFEDVISSAENQKKIAEQERQLAEQARRELDKLREEAQLERNKLEEQRLYQINRAKEEARNIVKRAKIESERIIVELRQQHGSANAERVIQSARDTLRRQESDLAAETEKKVDAGPSPKKVSPGQSVMVVSLGQKATVLTPADAKGEVQVQAGIIKLNVKLSDLRLIQEERTKCSPSAHVALDNARSIGLELDLRGMTLDEALIEVDRYLDNAFLSGLGEVCIIHGKGTGVLRTGIHNHLKHHTHVLEFRIGRYGEGETGVTLVKLK